MLKNIANAAKMAAMSVILFVPSAMLLGAAGFLEISKKVCRKLNGKRNLEKAFDALEQAQPGDSGIATVTVDDITVSRKVVDIDELFANDPSFLAQLKAAEEKETA